MKKLLRAKEGFTLIELMIVIAVIGILAAILIPYTFRAQDRARETGVQNAARAIQTGLEMYASNQTSAPWYPTTSTQITNTTGNALAALVSPAPTNPFNGKGYLVNIGGTNTPFYLGVTASAAAVEPGVIVYETDGNSYTLTLYGAGGATLPLKLTGGR
jgi:prepilin-type N-terminal cleavage/methylation domain-containing protein